MNIEELRSYIPKEVDMSDLLGDLYYAGIVARWNYIYDDNIDQLDDIIPLNVEFMLEELYRYYDLEEDEVEVKCDSDNLDDFKKNVDRLLEDGYTNIGVLIENTDSGFENVILVGIKKPVELEKVRNINERDDPNQEPIRVAFDKLIGDKYPAWGGPVIQVSGNYIRMNTLLGNNQPRDFDFMKYLIGHKKGIIKLIEDTVGIKPFYAKVIRKSYYGEMDIRYEIDDMNTLIGLLKIKGLPISYKDLNEF